MNLSNVTGLYWPFMMAGCVSTEAETFIVCTRTNWKMKLISNSQTFYFKGDVNPKEKWTYNNNISTNETFK